MEKLLVLLGLVVSLVSCDDYYVSAPIETYNGGVDQTTPPQQPTEPCPTPNYIWKDNLPQPAPLASCDKDFPKMICGELKSVQIIGSEPAAQYKAQIWYRNAQRWFYINSDDYYRICGAENMGYGNCITAIGHIETYYE